MLGSVSQAVIGALRDRRYPIITSYELFRLLWDVYGHPERYPIKIRKRVSSPGWLQYNKILTELGLDRLLKSDDDFSEPYSQINVKTKVFRVSEIPDAPAEDIACLVDPFASVSYLSAMHRYGLTVRQPKALTITTLEERLWRRRGDEKVRNDYGFDPAEAHLDFFRPLHIPPIPTRLRGRLIEGHRTVHPFRSQPTADSFSRIIEIGDLFVQMLHTPNLCGGMAHVLEVWEEHAEVYVNSIIEAVNVVAFSSITKVRAGYILSELIGISDPRIEAWKQFAQRGGSRKLDSSQPYSSIYSEEWMLSLNV